jgi:predicted DNA-binding transcriptional regulator YafY
MLRIHDLLKNKEYPNCTGIAKEFELSGRTVSRDIDFMRDRLRLPVEWDGQKNGYYYSRPVNEFPQLPMSEAETFALLVAHKAIAQYRGTSFQKPLEAAFRRLTGQLDQSVRFSLGSLDTVLSFRPFAPDDADLKVFEVLTRALRERRVVKLLYRNRGMVVAQSREVHPYHLSCVDNHWYLLAFDLKKSAIRTFSLTRMQKTELERKRFQIAKGFDVNDYLRNSFKVYKGDADGDYEIVVELDAWAADEIRGRSFHPSQEVTEAGMGMMRLRLRLNNLEEVERWLVSFGSHATVVRPRALRERLRKAGEALVQQYAATAASDEPD